LDSPIGTVYSVVDTHTTEAIPIFAFGVALERTNATLVVKRRLSNDLKRLT